MSYTVNEEPTKLRYPIYFHLHFEENVTPEEIKELCFRLCGVPNLQITVSEEELKNREVHLTLHR